MTSLVALAGLLAPLAADPTTDGTTSWSWSLVALFVGIGGAVVFLGFSLSKQLRKTRENAEAGVFGEVPEKSEGAEAAGTDAEGPEAR